MTEWQRARERELRLRMIRKLQRGEVPHVIFAGKRIHSAKAFKWLCLEMDEKCGGTFPVCLRSWS